MVSQLATTAYGKYDSHTLLAQSQLGKELIFENAKLFVAIYILIDVMRNNEKENEKLKVTLKATE